jgi:hypothetical protein
MILGVIDILSETSISSAAVGVSRVSIGTILCGDL